MLEIARGFAEVIHSKPPNFDAIAVAFPAVLTRKGILYTYGGNVYNPDGVPIPPWLIEHESAHIDQQRNIGAEEWWRRYLAEPQFRLAQELPAVLIEYKTFCETEPFPNRIKRAQFLDGIAERISSQLYGYMVRRKDAMRLLKQRV